MTIVQFELAGTKFNCAQLGIDEQFEVECILLTTFGPAVGAAIAALVEGGAPALIGVLRDATGAGDQFDLAKLMSRPKAAEKLRDHWLEALDVLCKRSRMGASISDLLAVPAADSTGHIASLWRQVVLELERIAAVPPAEIKDFVQSTPFEATAVAAAMGSEAPEIDYADPQLQAAWGELLAALVENLHETIGRGERFELAALLPLTGDVGPSWLTLLGASLAEVVRETAGRGRFDLAGLIRMDTADPRLRDAWETLLGTLASTLADLVRGAIHSLAGRLNVDDIKRLFFLVVLNKKVTVPTMENGYVTTYEAMSRILKNPQAKWDLLIRCLLVTYGGSDSSAEGGNA